MLVLVFIKRKNRKEVEKIVLEFFKKVGLKDKVDVYLRILLGG